MSFKGRDKDDIFDIASLQQDQLGQPISTTPRISKDGFHYSTEAVLACWCGNGIGNPGTDSESDIMGVHSFRCRARPLLPR